MESAHVSRAERAQAQARRRGLEDAFETARPSDRPGHGPVWRRLGWGRWANGGTGGGAATRGSGSWPKEAPLSLVAVLRANLSTQPSGLPLLGREHERSHRHRRRRGMHDAVRPATRSQQQRSVEVERLQGSRACVERRAWSKRRRVEGVSPTAEAAGSGVARAEAVGLAVVKGGRAGGALIGRGSAGCRPQAGWAWALDARPLPLACMRSRRAGQQNLGRSLTESHVSCLFVHSALASMPALRGPSACVNSACHD